MLPSYPYLQAPHTHIHVKRVVANSSQLAYRCRTADCTLPHIIRYLKAAEPFSPSCITYTHMLNVSTQTAVSLPIDPELLTLLRSWYKTTKRSSLSCTRSMSYRVCINISQPVHSVRAACCALVPAPSHHCLCAPTAHLTVFMQPQSTCLHVQSWSLSLTPGAIRYLQAAKLPLSTFTTSMFYSVHASASQPKVSLRIDPTLSNSNDSGCTRYNSDRRCLYEGEKRKVYVARRGAIGGPE